MLKIELLDKSHDRTQFDCGNLTLNIYLQKTARQHISKGMSRTFVLINDDNPRTILGFYTLSICEIETDYLPRKIAKQYPDQVPAVKLARLAVSMKKQNNGYGSYLIGSAVEKVILISEHVGIIGLFVDAKDDHVKKYYEQFGFISLQGNPLILFLPMQTLNKYK
ncbi:GCN5-related N-acetyltransferase [Desulfamplus magnetovallimortis]|uniref:GCN5-related N-acetyltransferase n=1 Tax=Desulfamplus magnetovallimortis TaxID=1246637 RepID=A0A1W1HFI2_9BACT|nr:GNAT family N-acetyltransferase [Desulfamplus magnetovallimortis]SLM31183.1 GCN5-related N-acetyltransferase [Desulfamplus magnetovallimortis]